MTRARRSHRRGLHARVDAASTPPTASPSTPNFFTLHERLWCAALGLGLLVYGILGLLTNRLSLTGRSLHIGILQGSPAWLMSAALLVGAAVLLSVVIDHYDKRNTERHYRLFRWIALHLGCCLAGAALLAHLYLGFTR